jgi:hypothetical protein
MIPAEMFKHIKTAPYLTLLLHAQLLVPCLAAATTRDVTEFNSSCLVITLIIKTITTNCAVRISIIQVQTNHFMVLTVLFCAGCPVEQRQDSYAPRMANCRYRVPVIVATCSGYSCFYSRPGNGLPNVIASGLLILSWMFSNTNIKEKQVHTSQETHYVSATESSPAVIMKNVVFCDIKPQFVLHRRHITSPLQSPAG